MLRSLPQLPTVPQNVEETSRLPLKIVHIDHAPSPWSLLEYLHYYIEDRADTDSPLLQWLSPAPCGNRTMEEKESGTMSSKGAGVTVALRSTYEEAQGPATARIFAGARPSSKNPQEKRRHYPWLGGYLQWLEGKEAREEYYGRLERMSGR
jgi:hypothetical protein